MSPSLTTSSWESNNFLKEPIRVGNTNPKEKGMNGVVYSEQGISPTITTNKGEGNKILTQINNEKVVGTLYTDALKSSLNGGFTEGEASKTLTTNCSILGITDKYRIRKLTPKECWRLMGMPDYQFDKLIVKNKKGKQLISNAQLYKQAGNSIVVDVLENIFYSMFKDTEYKPNNLPLRRNDITYKNK